MGDTEGLSFLNMCYMVDDFKEEYGRKKIENKDSEIKFKNRFIYIISTFTTVLSTKYRYSDSQSLQNFYSIITDLAGNEIGIKEAIGRFDVFKEDYIKYIQNMDGGRRNQLKHAEVKMKVIKGLCKANNIKLSRVIDGKRVPYNKKELLTKLKRKKII
jgi:hypothetical protein